jgi:hypothetical protein
LAYFGNAGEAVLDLGDDEHVHWGLWGYVSEGIDLDGWDDTNSSS